MPDGASSARVTTSAGDARKRTLLLLLIVCVFAMHAAWVSGWLIDDAYISFRYARNLVNGHGLVFNVGERVEGYTNFSWVLLSAACIWLRLPPTLVMPMLGAVSAMGLIVATARAGERLAQASGRAHPYGGLPGALAVACSPDVAWYSVSGLETTLFALLVGSAIWALVRRRAARFGVLTALAFFTRPEAGLVGVMGVIGLAITPRPSRAGMRQALRAAAVMAALVGPYLAFKLAYFHALAPNTLRAKTPDPWAGAAYLAMGVVPMIGLVAAGLVTLRARGARSPEGAIFGLWACSCVAVVLEGGDWMGGHRLLVPWFALLASVADSTLLVPFWRGGSRRRLYGLAIALACVGYVGACSWASRANAAKADPLMRANLDRERIVAMIARSGTRSIGTFDIGLPGWVAPDVTFLDLGGLVDRTIARTKGGYDDKHPPVDYLQAHAPDAFLFASNIPPRVDPRTHRIEVPTWIETEDYVKRLPWFREHYAYVRTFAPGGSGAYFLHWFVRRELASPALR